MATTKQIDYIISLMIDAGHAHSKYYFADSAFALSWGPDTRESMGHWTANLTKKEASEIIDELSL